MNTLVFAHHMGLEILGREYSPHGVVEHVCVFAVLGDDRRDIGDRDMGAGLSGRLIETVKAGMRR